MDSEILGKVYKRSNDIIYRKIAGETFLVPIRGSLADMQRIFVLNPTAECIWDLLSGEKSLREVSESIQTLFDITAEEANADLQEFISDLLGANLIAGAD